MRMNEIIPYQEVLDHRKECPKWGKEFCLKCFGGGLTKYTEALLKELYELQCFNDKGKDLYTDFLMD